MVTPLVDAAVNIAETLRDRHNYYGILLIGTYTRPDTRVSFQMTLYRVALTLNDLAKYSMTRNIAQFLCDSSSCCRTHEVTQSEFQQIKNRVSRQNLNSQNL